MEIGYRSIVWYSVPHISPHLWLFNRDNDDKTEGGKKCRVFSDNPTYVGGEVGAHPTTSSYCGSPAINPKSTKTIGFGKLDCTL